ncbi:MAG: methyltransferase domain-containing protein [Anaerolineae bacterium]|nr:methyltransferase domain-containing protein [Anaerolineae bacterium]
MTTELERLEQQKAYYRARAGEYDEWFERRGKYDHGEQWNARWRAEVEEVRRALAAFRPTGRVLELAAGTGWWTAELLRYADEVTVVDSSPETLAINRARVGDAPVRHVVADLFAWQPDRQYDMVFFSFWLSHVPPSQFAPFWGMVKAALKPGGRVFFIDSQRSQTGTAADQTLQLDEQVEQTRRLNDGNSYTIVKIYYTPADLQARLAQLGWDVTVRRTDNYFLYGEGVRHELTRREG